MIDNYGYGSIRINHIVSDVDTARNGRIFGAGWFAFFVDICKSGLSTFMVNRVSFGHTESHRGLVDLIHSLT